MNSLNNTSNSSVNRLSCLAVAFFDEIKSARKNGVSWYDITDSIKTTLEGSGRSSDFSALKLERYYNEVKRVKKTMEQW